MQMYENVAQSIGEGEVLTRAQVAERLGRQKTTTLIGHLERAVREGLLHKAWFNFGDYVAWGYATPATMPRLLEE